MAHFAIEIAGPHNESAMFLPIGNERLRGRWSHAKVAHRNKSQAPAGEAMKDLALATEIIPGLFIAIDTESRQGIILDPLAETPDGKRVHEAIKGVLARYPNALDCGPDPRPRSVFANLTVDDVKEWAFYMRTMLDTGAAVAISGQNSPPPISEIKGWPGKRRRDPGWHGPQDAESPEEARRGHSLYKWADEVPVEVGLVGAGAPAGGGPTGHPTGTAGDVGAAGGDGARGGKGGKQNNT